MRFLNLYQLTLHFTEAVNRDSKGVYIMGADGSKKYITQLKMEDGELND